MLLQKLPQLTGPTSWSLSRLTGTARLSGEPLQALYAGNGTNLSYLRNLVFQSAQVQVLERPATAWRLMSRLARLSGEADLLLSELPPMWAALIKMPGQIRVPAWVRQELDLPSRQAGQWLLPRHIEREADRQIRRHQYVVRFSSSEPDYRLFFHTLYRPYVQSRFGEGAMMLPEAIFLDRCRGHTLGILEAGGTALAAVLLKRQGQSGLRLGWFGCSSNPPPAGASEALDVMCIRHAYQSGSRRIVFGDSRPSLTDGVVRYKLKFGTHIVSTTFPQPTLALSVCRWSAQLAESLNAIQLVAIKNRRPVRWGMSYSASTATVQYFDI